MSLRLASMLAMLGLAAACGRSEEPAAVATVAENRAQAEADTARAASARSDAEAAGAARAREAMDRYDAEEKAREKAGR